MDPIAGATFEPRTEDAATWDALAVRHDDLLGRVRSS
jgi:hypothetical protein